MPDFFIDAMRHYRIILELKLDAVGLDRMEQANLDFINDRLGGTL